MNTRESYMQQLDINYESYDFRLRPGVRPLHYDLQFEFDLRQEKFQGLTTITFKTSEPIQYVALHAKGLNVSTETLQRVDFRASSRRLYEEFHSFPYKKHDFWITLFQSDLKEGEYQMRLRFNGKLDEQQIGIFTIPIDESVDRRHASLKGKDILLTRFLPNFAHLAFPCMDEPEMKATFSINITFKEDDGYFALSNMDVIEKSTSEGKTKVRFAVTPPMSPHLVTFMLTNFKYTMEVVYTALRTSLKPIEVRVYAEQKNLYKTEYALALTTALLIYITDYLHIAYPLPKLDLVAIPKNLKAGLVENWGLLYFDEQVLLYEQGENTTANKQRIATLVAHGLVRMWVGGLVSLSWWDQLWLSKGLAFYLEYKCVEQVEPTWGLMEQFLILDLYPVMIIDAQSNTHALNAKIDNERKIPNAFDELAYMKGTALIRMLESMIGPETLRIETSKFVSKYAYSAAQAEDFINVLQAGLPDVPLVKILQSFTEQMGFPFLTVIRQEENAFKVTQNRFLADPEDYKHKLRSAKVFFNWTIPVTYVLSSNNIDVQQAIFYRYESHLTLKLNEDATNNKPLRKDEVTIRWIKLNKDHIGYYRVNYSGELWEALIEALTENLQQFSISDRAQLISDSFALANAAQLSFVVPLKLLGYMVEETEFVPWYVAVTELKKLKDYLQSCSAHEGFFEFVKHLLNGIYGRMSWTQRNLTHTQNLLRVTIFDAACAFGLPMALNACVELFRRWLAVEDFPMHIDLLGILLLYGMQEIGHAEIWQIVWTRFNSASAHSSLRRRLLHSLAAISDETILKRLIKSIVNSETVSDEEVLKCLEYVASNAVGSKLVWDYVRFNWEEQLLQRFTQFNAGLSNLIPQITANFSTHAKLDEVQQFFDDFQGRGVSVSARHEAINRIQYNIRWLRNYEGTIATWISVQFSAGNLPQTSASDVFYSKTSMYSDV